MIIQLAAKAGLDMFGIRPRKKNAAVKKTNSEVIFRRKVRILI